MNNTTRRFTAGIAILLIGLSLTIAVNLTAPHTVRANPGVLYAAPTAQGSGNCSSWANACTLQTALAQAQSGDEIWVQAGVHYPGAAGNRTVTFTLKNGVALYGGFAGTETTRDQRDWQANRTILSGDIDKNDTNTDGNLIAETWNDIQGNNAYHVVASSGTNATAVLDGFIITAGQANGGSMNDYGGGMYNDNNSNPQLTRVNFSGNSAKYGGGMHNEYLSSPTLTNVAFSGNSANYGGGISNAGSSPTLKNVTFSGNSASYHGGGVHNYNYSSPALTNVTFSGNSASSNGGGIYNEYYSDPTLTNAIMWGNTASNGAGIYKDVTSAPTIFYSDIQGCFTSGAWNGTCGANSGGNIEADPLFVDAANGSLRLDFGSPAIDVGTNSGCPSTDLDGLPRPTDGDGDGTATCDMGAYETGTMLCSAPYTFNDQSGVAVDITTPGNLVCVYVDEMRLSHPQATPGLQTGRYWLVRGLLADKQSDASGFTVNLTLPTTFTPDANDKVCRYTGSGQVWDCAASGYTGNTITRAGVSAFSDWAAGDNVGPTAITLLRLSAHAPKPHPAWLMLIPVLLAGIWLPVRQATRLKFKQRSSAGSHQRRRPGRG